MKIGYIRVSTQEQNTDRQEVLLEQLGVEELYIDKASGKNTDRPELKKMMAYVRRGDIVIVESISRFARNCIFRPSESKETVGVSPPSREKQVQVHGRESTGVLFWKEMAKERFAKRSSACHLFRLESFSFAHGVISIDEDLVGTVLNPVQHSIC